MQHTSQRKSQRQRQALIIAGSLIVIAGLVLAYYMQHRNEGRAPGAKRVQTVPSGRTTDLTIGNRSANTDIASDNATKKPGTGPKALPPPLPTFPVNKLQQSTAAEKEATLKRLRAGLATRKGPVVHGFVAALVGGRRYGVKGASVRLVRVGEFETRNAGGFVAPVDGAPVYAMDTVEGGVFALRSDIPDGDYVLEVSSPHDLNLTSGRQQVRVADGKDVRVEVKLRPGYLLRGCAVRPGTKSPVGGVRITAHSLRKDVQWSRVVQTDNMGRYVLHLKSELPCKLIVSGPEGGSLFIERIEASEAVKDSVYTGVVTRDVTLTSGRIEIDPDASAPVRDAVINVEPRED